MLRKREAGLARRLVQFRLTDPEPMLFHNEAMVRDGRIVGTVTSGNYGHALGGAVGLGYVPCEGQSADEVLASTYEIEIAGRRLRGGGVAGADVRPESRARADVTGRPGAVCPRTPRGCFGQSMEGTW